MNDKERIAELADAFNKVCDENADFVAESIKADRRIAELTAQLKHCEGHAAELEAEVMEFRSRGNVAMSSWDEEREHALRDGERVVALEAEVKTLREDEMLLIERCAKVCEELEIEFCEEYKRSGYASYHEGMTDGAGNCVEAIRALKEAK